MAQLDLYWRRQALAGAVPLQIATDIPEPPPPCRPLCSLTAWLAGRHRHLVCRTGNASVELQVAGLGRFTVARRAPYAVTLAELEPQSTMAELAEVLLGPVAVLTLAWRGVFTLHASAIEIDGRAVALLGESGRGKSTLAMHAGVAGWRRAVDDILPVEQHSAGVSILPRFPQLKLPPAQRYPAAAPNRLPLARVVVLDEQAAAPQLRALTGGEQLRLLVRHTVAVKLFDRSLHQAQLAFMRRVCEFATPVSIAYPRDYRRLPEVYACLRDLLAQPGFSR